MYVASHECLGKSASPNSVTKPETTLEFSSSPPVGRSLDDEPTPVRNRSVDHQIDLRFQPPFRHNATIATPRPIAVSEITHQIPALPH